MAKRGFGLVLLIFRGRDTRGLVKAYCQADLFLACRHTKTASIKAWAEVSSLRRASQMFFFGGSLGSTQIIPLPTGSFSSVGTSRRDGGGRGCCSPRCVGAQIL